MQAYTAASHGLGSNAPEAHAERRTRGLRPSKLSATELAILIATAVCVLLAAFAPALHSSTPSLTQSVTIKVSNAQTLWGIAQEHPIAGYSTGQTVQAIREANDLTVSELHAGQLLRVPTGSDAVTAMASR